MLPGFGSFTLPAQSLSFLEPTNGKRLLFIGQDLESVEAYISNCDSCPTPGGLSTYLSLEGLLRPKFYGGLGWTHKDKPYKDRIDWGGGPLSAYQAVAVHPESAIQIGLYMVGKAQDVYLGGLDEEIKQLADFFKAFPQTAFYLRIGYEFDGQWNGYDPIPYIRAFRAIVDLLKAEGVNNVAYVWQACTSPVDDILDRGREDLMRYYPGDEYVDWMGLSWFLRLDIQASNGETPSTQRFLMDELLSLAREKGKPVMICESTPQGYHIANQTQANIASVWDGRAGKEVVTKTADQIWQEWYQPFFEYIETHQDVIKAVTYINAHWDVQGLWNAPYEQGYWGDSRIQAHDTIQARWLQELAKPGWLHGSSTLTDYLHGMPETKE